MCKHYKSNKYIIRTHKYSSPNLSINLNGLRLSKCEFTIITLSVVLSNKNIIYMKLLKKLLTQILTSICKYHDG